MFEKEVAHIHPASAGGPRPWGDETYTEDFLRSYANLILLCPRHHKTIDDNWEDYPADEVMAWKAAASTASTNEAQAAIDADIASDEEGIGVAPELSEWVAENGQQ